MIVVIPVVLPMIVGSGAAESADHHQESCPPVLHGNEKGERERTSGDKADKDENRRALERALVQAGASVLPPWQLEIEPELSYIYDEQDTTRRDGLKATAAFRLGFPGSLQAEVAVPYVLFESRSLTGEVAGLGDIRFEVTKLIVTERESVPEILLSAAWKTTTGRPDSALFLGTGGSTLQLEVTAVKRREPIVFTVSPYYNWNMPSSSGGYRPGDSVGAALGAFLAVTPDTSLYFAIDTAWIFSGRSAGQAVAGTDGLSGIFSIGAPSVISKGLLLNVTAQIGFTKFAPNFELDLSLPYRF